jgi:hypothetical protein
MITLIAFCALATSVMGNISSGSGNHWVATT